MPPCLLDDCHYDGSSGFCCSGNCIQDISDISGKNGTCEKMEQPTSTTPTNTPTLIIENTTSPLFVEDLKDPDTISRITIIAISVSTVILVIILGLIIWLYYRHRQKRTLFQKYAGLICHTLSKYSMKHIAALPYEKHWEIPESNFSVDRNKQLGSGCFGLVLLGKVNGEDVAAKTLHSSSMDTIDGYQIRSLLLEMTILQHIGKFEHIVRLVGCYTSKLASGNIGMQHFCKINALEYCPFGSLESYLRKYRHTFEGDRDASLCSSRYQISTVDDSNKITSHDLLLWSLQITNAMKYLVSKKVIHADIATRNVLLLRKDCAKLTDFGLARRLNEYSRYVKKHQEPLPWKWMALETLLELSFSYQSDMWSLGITFWEIYSLGEEPYPGLSWTSEFTNLLKQNVRPPKPSYAPNEIFEIMQNCWNKNPSSRPTSEEVFCRLYDYQQTST